MATMATTMATFRELFSRRVSTTKSILADEADEHGGPNLVHCNVCPSV